MHGKPGTIWDPICSRDESAFLKIIKGSDHTAASHAQNYGQNESIIINK